jgi:hypothetical protein
MVFLLVLCNAGLTALARDGMYDSEIYGRVISNEGGFLHIVGESFGAPEEIVVNTDYASVYDLLTGFPIRTRDLAESMAVQVLHMGDYAAVVWANYESENAAAFKAITSENIQYTAEDCAFLTLDGKYRVVLTPDTLIIDPFAGALTPLDILPGHEMFIWVDMVTASSPALVYPEKVVLVY